MITGTAPARRHERVSPRECYLQREKVRIYALARELNIDSKDLLDMCRQAGYDKVKNQLSSLDPEQRDAIEAMVKRGGGGTAVAAPPAPSSTHAVGAPVPVLTPQKPRTLPSRGARPAHPAPAEPAAAVPPPAAPKPTAPPATPPPAAAKSSEQPVPKPAERPPLKAPPGRPVDAVPAAPTAHPKPSAPPV